MSFGLSQLPLLSRESVPRDDQQRTNTEALQQRWADAKVLFLDTRGAFTLEENTLVFHSSREVGSQPPHEGAVYLGRHSDAENAAGDLPSTDIWAVEVPKLDGQTYDLRTIGHTLSARDASLISTAVAILSWQGRTRFASWSGEPLALAKGGWVRIAADGTQEFPRVDPAIICLVHDGEDRVLLARQPVWKRRWFSVLAGFCEPGESLEQCVEREIREEVGIDVTQITYLGSQPWPFPRSLMVGFEAVGDPNQPLALASEEIEEARWFHRAEVEKSLGADWRHETSEAEFLLPGTVSIARMMIDSWVHARSSHSNR